ncbi:hypothetical protein BDQ17DRAFT_638219 [Cyathus striatus]|nr:hypothetical protein BDQ17DRAFT_638219 [Cyathus striatus]
MNFSKLIVALFAASSVLAFSAGPINQPQDLLTPDQPEYDEINKDIQHLEHCGTIVTLEDQIAAEAKVKIAIARMAIYCDNCYFGPVNVKCGGWLDTSWKALW